MKLERITPEFLHDHVPEGALVFANSGTGDYLFLVPGHDTVMVYWNEGPEIAEYCSSLDELSPSKVRPPTRHSPIRYFHSDEVVHPGDSVLVNYWLFWKGEGVVTYVPGVSPLKRELERDGLAWVRTKLNSGTLVDTIVIDGALQRGVTLLGRGTRKSGDAV